MREVIVEIAIKTSKNSSTGQDFFKLDIKAGERSAEPFRNQAISTPPSQLVNFTKHLG